MYVFISICLSLCLYIAKLYLRAIYIMQDPCDLTSDTAMMTRQQIVQIRKFFGGDDAPFKQPLETFMLFSDLWTTQMGMIEGILNMTDHARLLAVLRVRVRWVYTSDGVKRFVALSRASQQIRVKALAAYLFILPTPASARVNARQKAWRGARCNKVQQC